MVVLYRLVVVQVEQKLQTYNQIQRGQKQEEASRYRKIQKAILFFCFHFFQGGGFPLETPFVGEMIMEEKEKLIVFFLSRIGSGAWPLVNPLFHVCFVSQG